MGELYQADYYRDHFAHESEYRAAARVLHFYLGYPGIHAVDYGCGVGILLDELLALGWEARGFEVSPIAARHAPAAAAAKIRYRPLRGDPFVFAYSSFTVVHCAEVAEHLPPEDAPALVRVLCDLRANVEHARIVFSAAPPGQGGHGHINERPKDDWVEQFAAQGRAVDERLTRLLSEGWREACPKMWWLAKNVVVFK